LNYRQNNFVDQINDCPISLLLHFFRNRTLSSNLALGYKGGLLEGGTKFIQLWLSWRNGIITAGTGEVIGQHTMVTYLPMPPVTSISTAAINSYYYTANWVIPYDQVTSKSTFVGKF